MKNNMTHEQIERYLNILEEKNKIALGISQALFMAVGLDPWDGSRDERNGIKIQK